MSHELSDEKEMTCYFAKKFAPATPVVVVARSYKSSPTCMAVETLFDNWKDRDCYEETQNPQPSQIALTLVPYYK